MDKPNDPAFYSLLVSSFARLLGRPFITNHDMGNHDTAFQASWLYHKAPFCVLAHNTQPDPIFTYANRAAQTCFGYDWAEFTRLPSRLSAEALNRAERQCLLDEVARAGFIENYRGARIAKSGQRFWIENAIVWQLIDDAGRLHGQAAMFQHQPEA
ncbi:MAG: MEKHLA domain-containing protein [Rhodospirillales bacterium]|nr:MEKHLA domain-containing protein [Rhodospirillales bacterium]